jgi:hypothetical protein
MDTAPVLSLRSIATQVDRSHTLVQRLIANYGLADCAPDIKLAAAHLVLRRRIPADAVAKWAKRTERMPTGGWLVYAEGEVQLIDSPTTLRLLLGNPSLDNVSAVRVASLTYSSP